MVLPLVFTHRACSRNGLTFSLYTQGLF
ncbi:hypothetical protein ACOMHN_035678 [Nucella lapillus]